MKILIFIFAFLLSQQLSAKDLKPFSTPRSEGPYLGFGFGYSNLSLRPVSNKVSKFEGWNGAATGGFNFNISGAFGVDLSAEYKLTDATNTVDNTSYMETAKVTAKSAKLGLYIGAFMVGAGMSKTEMDVKSVAASSAGEITKFSGTTKMLFANYGFELGVLRAAIEGQYSNGTLDDIKYQDYSVGLRLLFLLSN